MCSQQSLGWSLPAENQAGKPVCVLGGLFATELPPRGGLHEGMSCLNDLSWEKKEYKSVNEPFCPD